MTAPVAALGTVMSTSRPGTIRQTSASSPTLTSDSAASPRRHTDGAGVGRDRHLVAVMNAPACRSWSNSGSRRLRRGRPSGSEIDRIVASALAAVRSSITRGRAVRRAHRVGVMAPRRRRGNGAPGADRADTPEGAGVALGSGDALTAVVGRATPAARSAVEARDPAEPRVVRTATTTASETSTAIPAATTSHRDRSRDCRASISRPPGGAAARDPQRSPRLRRGPARPTLHLEDRQLHRCRPTGPGSDHPARPAGRGSPAQQPREPPGAARCPP